MSRPEIVATRIRRYGDNGQVTAYVEWSDGTRTEGAPDNPHIAALLGRARRECKPHAQEVW